jgi:DNA-binding NarL/FixJ family response regulator
MSSLVHLSMKAEEALELLDKIPKQEQLTALQKLILCYAWDGLTYPEIADKMGYAHEYIKHVGNQIWRSLSQTLGEPVSKYNFRAAMQRYARRQRL